MRGLVVAGVGLAVVSVGAVALAAKSMHDEGRGMWLIRGKHYAISARMVGPGWDASMFPGFCNFSQPVITGQGNASDGTGWTEVQFTAEWCAENVQWDVPENIAVSEM